MKIVFPDNSVKEFPKGSTGLEIAKSIGERLAMAAIAIQVDGVAQDLNKKIEKDCKINILTFKNPEGVEVFRHSSAHILGAAVTELFPKAKPTIGPAVEQGFYYDFASSPFNQEDLEKINKKMEEIIKQNIPFERVELTKAEAKKLFKDNKYKLELIDEAEGNISAYKLGKFTDLCRGPHVPSTGSIKAIKTTKMGSAYWKGDSKNDSLQRIYGISFTDKKDLDNYFKMLEEAEKRDHRKIGKEQDLFMLSDLSLAGCPFFLPKGTIVYNELLNFIRTEYLKRGYEEVITPQIFKKELWEISGHWEHYKENMFTLKIGDQEYSLKPMNCPSHLLIYNSKSRSYRDLPLRIADFCFLHRNELGGVLGGITRVVKFSQDDSHIFLTHEQIEDEIKSLLEFIKHVYFDTFKMEYNVKLSTRPEGFLGEKKVWDDAEKSLANALTKVGLKYEVKQGEGAFYGPKIDFDVKDCIGREHQLATIQLDFQLPLRFNSVYEGKDGKKHSVVMIHRAILGSLERFMGVMIEHYAGKFPLWLSPVQVKILPIADRHLDYANKVAKAMKEQGVRVEVDTRVESTPKKVYDAQMEKVNYILVVGDKEIENATATVRKRDSDKLEVKKVDVLIKELLEEIKTKAIK